MTWRHAPPPALTGSVKNAKGPSERKPATEPTFARPTAGRATVGRQLLTDELHTPFSPVYNYSYGLI